MRPFRRIDISSPSWVRNTALKALALLGAFTSTKQCTGMQAINTSKLEGLLSSTKVKYIRLKFGPQFVS